jgi:hypothetical protein
MTPRHVNFPSHARAAQRQHVWAYPLELRTIRENSIFERLGMLASDVVLRINDRPCATLEEAASALLGACETRALVARLERTGEPFDLDIRVGSGED